MGNKIQELQDKISQVDIGFHLNTIELELTKVGIIMAAPKVVISDYVNYKAEKDIFNYQEFFDWCKVREVKLYAEDLNRKILSKVKAYLINRQLKEMGILLDEDITMVWLILNEPKIIENIRKRKKEKILEYIEEKVNNVVMYGY